MQNEPALGSPAILELMATGGFEDVLRADERDGHFNITCETPWAGDSIDGFGSETSVALNREQAQALADWIYGRLGLMMPH